MRRSFGGVLGLVLAIRLAQGVDMSYWRTSSRGSTPRDAWASLLLAQEFFGRYVQRLRELGNYGKSNIVWPVSIASISIRSSSASVLAWWRS